MDLTDFTEGQPVINAKLDDSISTCIHLLEDRFETIHLSESDSDDEGLEHSEVVLKPRKCYGERPLPHIIGSYKFLNDSTLGLSFILQEKEDGLEAEDELCNLLSRIKEEDSFHPHKVVAGSELHQEKHSSRNSAIEKDQHFNYDDGDFRRSISVTTVTHSKTVNPCTDFSNPMETTNELSVNTSDNAEEKQYSKEVMKSVLENLYNTPSQGKNKTGNLHAVEKIKSLTGNEFEEREDPVIYHQKPLRLNFFDNDVEIDLCPELIHSTGSFLDGDVFLPNVPTKTLHSLSKNRARNQKKRPPSRKKRDVDSYSKLASAALPPEFDQDFHIKSVENIREKEKSISKTVSNNLISPSTDEEDFFTISHSTIPSDLSSDRLFQPFTHKNTFLITKKSSLDPDTPNHTQLQQEKTSFWDHFADDDFFSKNVTSCDSQKLTKRPEQTLGVTTPSDENLFSEVQHQSKPSFFDQVFSAEGKSSVISLFDEPDDDSLFSGTLDKHYINGISREQCTGLEGVTSPSKTKSKSEFLSDPLGFNQNCELE